MRSFMLLALLHIEETDARKVVSLEQAPAQELLLDLANLHSLHTTAVGRKLARGLLTHLLQLICRGAGQQQRKELFLERAQVAFQFFIGERLLGELFEALGDFLERRGDGGGTVEGGRGGTEVMRDAVMLKASGFQPVLANRRRLPPAWLRQLP